MSDNKINKRKGVAVLLWFIGLLGYLNIHNFYLGRNSIGAIKTGLLCSVFITMPVGVITDTALPAYILSVVIMLLFVWNIIDLISILKLKATGGTIAYEPKTPLEEKYKKAIKTRAIIVISVAILASAGALVLLVISYKQSDITVDDNNYHAVYDVTNREFMGDRVVIDTSKVTGIYNPKTHLFSGSFEDDSLSIIASEVPVEDFSVVSGELGNIISLARDKYDSKVNTSGLIFCMTYILSVVFSVVLISSNNKRVRELAAKNA